MRITLIIVSFILAAIIVLLWKFSPFLSSWQPSEAAKSAGDPVTIELEQLKVGTPIRVEWRGKPISVMRLSDLNKSNLEKLNEYVCRSSVDKLNDSIVVIEQISTHLGCIVEHIPKESIPDGFNTWFGGYRDPCHGYLYDYAGRVIDNSPPNKAFKPHVSGGPQACDLLDLSSPGHTIEENAVVIHG